jgi:hypothetical protein
MQLETNRRNATGMGVSSLMAKIVSPFDEQDFIILPDAWLGEHAQRHDEAVEKATAAKMPRTWRDFAVSLALLDDWKLPGLSGNPEKWDFATISLPIMAWVKQVTLEAYYANFVIPKNS